MELNPNHPVTRAASDHWHKIVAVLMWKLGKRNIELGDADFDGFAQSGFGAVVLDEKEARRLICLKLITFEEAEKLAKQAGGLPH